MLPLLRTLTASLLFLLVFGNDSPGRTILAEGYALRVWQTEDGLPQNMVTSAVQTRDGYLWFGTYSGLTRFDGERFEVFDSANTPGLLDRRIACLFEDAEGTLWIGHEAGVVTRYRRGKFEPFLRATGTIGEKVIGLGSDEPGHRWAMRADGAIDSLDQPGTRIPSPIAPDHPGVMAWTRNSRGQIWLAENGQASRLADGRLVPLSLPPPQTDSYVLGIAASAQEGAWVLCDNRIRQWKDGGWTQDRGAFPGKLDPLSCSLELGDGTLAIGTIYSGLYLIFPDGHRVVHIDRANGLPQNWVRFLFQDREGNLWIGTGTAGLVSLHPTALSVLNSPDQWQGCTVLSVAPGRAGDLWIGTDGAALYHYASGNWQHYGSDEGLGNAYIPAVAVTPDGSVWAGHFWWGSPFRLEQGHFVRPPFVDEKSSPVFALLAGAGPEDLLVGSRDGLMQLNGGRASWLMKTPGSSAGAACALARDRQGGIWCGFGEGGLAHLVDGKATLFGRADGLASDAVMSLLVDDDDTLWIGTADGGLSRFQHGRFSNLGPAQGVADKFVGQILDDGLGFLWLSTHHGLQRVAKTALNQCADGATRTFPSQIYDHRDGLPTIEFTGGLQAAACRTSDGRLWFASNHGLVNVAPAQISSNPIAPPVVLESLLVDGAQVPSLRGSAGVRLSPNHQRLEFRFSGLSFVAPDKVLFKYRLEGIDGAWIDAGTKRVAFYSRLPAGTYRFRVIACNNDGVWNTDGATLAFTVAPFFWETWWFVSGSLLVAAAAIALFARQLTRRRLQRKIAQMERAHAVERERARIAQDIHDDVGASLSHIAMLSQPARATLADPERTATTLARIYTTAREVTRALDEIVWAVDPRHDTLDSLVDYMGKFAQKILATAGLRCRLDLPVDVPAWPLTAETRHNLFLAFKEALNNTVRHAAASEVRLSFSLHPDSFVFTVRDNGRGLPAAPLPAGPDRVASGHGIPNMHARMARIGGRCEIASVSGQGTTVVFTVGATARPAPPSDDPPPSSGPSAG